MKFLLEGPRPRSTNPFFTALIGALTLMGCAHPPQAQMSDEAAARLLQIAQEERFIAQALEAPAKPMLLISEFKKGVFAEEKNGIVKSAEHYLASDRPVSFPRLAYSFTDEQGIAFLEHLRNTQPSLFVRPSEKQVLDKLDQALAESTQGGGEVHLIASPELVTRVRELAKFSPDLAKVAYEVEKKLGLPLIERRACSEFNVKNISQRTRMIEWFRQSGLLANEVLALKPMDPEKCFLEATANRFTAYLNDVVLAKNWVGHCGLANSGSLIYFQSMMSGGSKPEVSLARLRGCQLSPTQN